MKVSKCGTTLLLVVCCNSHSVSVVGSTDASANFMDGAHQAPTESIGMCPTHTDDAVLVTSTRLRCFSASPLIGSVPGIPARIAIVGPLTRHAGRSFIGATQVSFAPGKEEYCEGPVVATGTVSYARSQVDEFDSADASDAPPKLIDVQIVVSNPEAALTSRCQLVPLVREDAAQALPDPDECEFGRAARQQSWEVMIYFVPSGGVKFVDVQAPHDQDEAVACVKSHFMKLAIAPFGGLPVVRQKNFIAKKKSQRGR